MGLAVDYNQNVKKKVQKQLIFIWGFNMEF